jgi:predicted DNA binding CopG/RHH family protein
MSRIKYTNERLGRLRVVSDFLPPPAELAFRDDGVKVTISLSRKSVDFFKAEARKHNTQYQRMIRKLLDSYAERYMESSNNRMERTRER